VARQISWHGLAVPGRATIIVELHVDRFQERPRTNHPWRQVNDSHKNCGKVLLRSRICSSKLSKSQRGPSHPQGPRPINRRHLSADQKMFGRGRRRRFCGVKSSFGPSMFRKYECPRASGQWLGVYRL
jgi:hypothetical protein